MQCSFFSLTAGDQLVKAGQGLGEIEVPARMTVSIWPVSFIRAVAAAEVKCPQVAMLFRAPLHVAGICKSVGVSERLVFKVKSTNVKDVHDLKIVISKGLKPKEDAHRHKMR
jgi:hypothetical protein